MTLSIRVSSSSTTTFIIFFCYGKEQIDNNQSLKLKETVMVICSKATEPTACRRSHCSFFFFSVWWPLLHIFQFQFSFWNHMLLENKVLQQTWFSDRGYFLFGVAEKITCWFGNCKKKLRCQQFHGLTSAKAFHIDNSFTFRKKNSYPSFICVKQQNLKTIYLLYL